MSGNVDRPIVSGTYTLTPWARCRSLRTGSNLSPRSENWFAPNRVLVAVGSRCQAGVGPVPKSSYDFGYEHLRGVPPLDIA